MFLEFRADHYMIILSCESIVPTYHRSQSVLNYIIIKKSNFVTRLCIPQASQGHVTSVLCKFRVGVALQATR